jgi:hypothetical protein
MTKICENNTPPWFTGHWHDWHRGHGCPQDDGKPRSPEGLTEVAQHAANQDTGYLTDAELRFLRASTTSGDDLLVRALDELKERRAADKRHAIAPFDHSTRVIKQRLEVLGYCVCIHCTKLPAFDPTEAEQ